MNRSKFFFLLLCCFPAFSQSGKPVHFRIVPDCTGCDVSAQDVNVVDIVNEKSAVSDAGGRFMMPASAGDVLILQKETFEYTRRIIEDEDLKTDEVIIRMIPKPVELKEVVVTQKAPADDLVKRHADHRKFTPAERHLYTATTGLFDPLINLISGRTKQLKKQLDVEMKERLLARLHTQFDESFYTGRLKIPEDYVRDFQYYLIEDDAFVSAMKSKNKTLMQFEAAQLAQSYLILIRAMSN